MPHTMILHVPTINDDNDAFKYLFDVWNKTNSYNKELHFDFSQCTFLRPNAVAFIGGLARQIESRAGRVTFDWNSINNKSFLKYLTRNGFTAKFGYKFSNQSKTSIPYREDIQMDANGIMDYLTDGWLRNGWIHVSERLKNAIAGKMWEIYNNAFEHAGSQIGVFSCGQYYKNLNQLILTVIDFGQGIASNVRNFFKTDPRANQLTAATCLKWAFGPGNTTRPNGIARGLGLDLLKEFIKINHGKLEVYSNEGYALIDANNEYFFNSPSYFEGTIFHITLICDESYYLFTDEI